MFRPTRRSGFSLIELLVIIAIITILMALILPAIQKVRAAADTMRCKSNQRQLGIALHAYVNDFGTLPPASFHPPGITSESWSAQARLLPYIEQDNLYKQIDFDQNYNLYSHVAQVRVRILHCPTDPKIRPRPAGSIIHFPINYAANQGTWFLYDPISGRGGDGAFIVTNRRPTGMFGFQAFNGDGTSNTLGFSEVKAYTPYLRDSGTPGTIGVPPPEDPAVVVAWGGEFKVDSGHTEWVDGRVHQAGFTTTFRPNTKVPYLHDGIEYDVDFNSSREGKTTNLPTYAAITARSYHANHVNALFMDGSARPIYNSIRLEVWRALGTRNGGEPISSDQLE